ncbi:MULTISPECIES: META domain-containing protein [unclassified Arthrobacter]|uniref:META domain-containing protein n=1 Tax=unclassified Arthrobacter TaxID=235627 RepID=UPI00339513AE
MPTPSSTSFATPTNSATPTDSTPGSTGTAAPQETCAAFLPSTPCTKYTSVSGTASGKDLPWVASGGVRAQLTSVNGELQLTVTTKCGPMSGQATVTGNTLNARNIATGAVGCSGDVGEQHLWVLEFLKRPIELTFSQGTLTWKSGTDTLSFKSE